MRTLHASRRTARHLGVALLAAAALLGACGGDDDEDSAGEGIASLLARMPSVDRGSDLVMYTYGDLARASQLAGLTRPDSPSSADDFTALAEWAVALAGVVPGDDRSTVAAPLPEAASPTRLDEYEAIVDEVGWSLADVDRFLEFAAPPERFTLIDGTVDTKAVEAAVGAPRNDIWSAGTGDDFESAFDEVSPARPLGVPIRMAARGALFAVTPSTDMAGQFVDGDDVGGDEGFTAVAERLDDADVYGAYLATHDNDRGSPYDTVGLGVAVDDDGPLVVIVYHYADDEAASDAVADVEDVLAGESARTRAPWSEIFPESEVTAEGNDVVARLRLADDRSPAIIRDILFVGDSLVDF
jgi:hypothetical protein